MLLHRQFAILATMAILCGTLSAFAQGQGRNKGIDPFNIFELMERRDLRLSEIDALARKYFERVGRERGTGHKQYERWKHEIQFHLDENGFILPPEYDAQQYIAASSLMTSAAQGAWSESGPTRWNNTSGWNPGVGRVTSIAVSPADTTIIYITTPGGGIWKSASGGNQWAALADQNNGMMNMYAVAVDPADPNVVFSGNTGGTIYKSFDGGTTWTSVASNAGYIKKILFHPSDPQIVYAVGSGGISRSLDRGFSFSNNYPGSVEDIEFKPDNPSQLIASGSSMVRSSDGGNTWSLLGTANGINFAARTLVSVSPADPNVIYAVQANGSEFGRLLRSTDFGTGFVTMITGSSASGTNFFGYETTGTGVGGQAGYDMAMTVNPKNANEVHIAGIICWKSSNGGSSFVPETAWSLPNSVGYNHADVHVLEWVGKTIYSGSDGGIYKSLDYGDNWTDLTSGLGIRQFYKISTAKTDGSILTGGAQDNGSSIMKSTGWIDWLGADGMDCAISPLDPKIIIGTSQYGSLYRTLDGGATRTSLSKPLNGAWVTPIAMESGSNIFYAGFNKGVYKYTNYGSAYTLISDTVNQMKTAINALAVAPSDPKYIYASSGSTIWVTKDAGATWGQYGAPSTVNSIAIDPTNPEKVWYTCNSTAYRVLFSNNACSTFTNISGDLPAIAARSVVVDDTGNEGLYAAMNIGVYYRNKNMTSWVNLTDNLPQVAINEVEIHKVAGKIRIGTYGRGAWERAIYLPCDAPSGLSANNITASGADLSWNASTSATAYQVDYKATSLSTWTTAATNTTQTSIPLTGLSQGTTYDWRVTSTCLSGSGMAVTSSFTTLTPCGMPASLSASTGTTTATLSWSGVTGATSYSVDYKTAATGTWTTADANLANTNISLSGLLENTAYTWRISATCPSGTGNYASSSFTTTITCNAPLNLQATNLSSSSASLSWSAVAGATGYTLQYKTAVSATWVTSVTNTTATIQNLSGLTASTSYNWRVLATCGTNGLSAYTESSFSTAPAPCTDAFESNNTSKNAKSIGYPSEITGLISSTTDIDWFKFVTTTSATKIKLTLFNLPANYDLFLYDKNLLPIGQSINTGNTSELVIYNGTATRTTYYIKVVGSGGTFNASSCYTMKLEAGSANFVPLFNMSSSAMPVKAEMETGGLTLHPNPAHSQAVISLTCRNRSKANIQLVEMSGKVLSNESVDMIEGTNRFNLDLKQYAKGVYLVRVVTTGRTYLQKIVIQ